MLNNILSQARGVWCHQAGRVTSITLTGCGTDYNTHMYSLHDFISTESLGHMHGSTNHNTRSTHQSQHRLRNTSLSASSRDVETTNHNAQRTLGGGSALITARGSRLFTKGRVDIVVAVSVE